MPGAATQLMENKAKNETASDRNDAYYVECEKTEKEWIEVETNFQNAIAKALNEDARKKPRADVERGLKATMDDVNAKLEPHECVAKVVVVKEAWTIDNGMVTPTMKIKRNAVEARYTDLLQKEIQQRNAVAWED